jgi:hypothetical protein
MGIKMNKWELIKILEDKGVVLEEYPTDSEDGSNTGDGVLYKYDGKFYEVVKDRENMVSHPRVFVHEVKGDYVDKYK